MPARAAGPRVDREIYHTIGGRAPGGISKTPIK
jgi:hypothetical protein